MSFPWSEAGLTQREVGPAAKGMVLQMGIEVIKTYAYVGSMLLPGPEDAIMAAIARTRGLKVIVQGGKRVWAKIAGKGTKCLEEAEEKTIIAEYNAAKRTNTVYRAVDSAGEVKYVGITNNLARRAAEHLRTKGIQIEKLMGNLSRTDARAVEQALIEIHGLGANGGTLLNKINSIARTNPAYADQLRRGLELLRSIGYRE
jgi:hypothetical protein